MKMTMDRSMLLFGLVMLALVSVLAIATPTQASTLPPTANPVVSRSFIKPGVCEGAADPSEVGCWQMDDGIGSPTIADGSIYGNTGELRNSATLTTTTRTGTGGSLRVNNTTTCTGNSQHAYITDTARLQITSSLTIAAWVRPERVGTQALVYKAINTTTGGYDFALSSSGSSWPQKGFFRVNQIPSGDTYRVNSTTLYPTNGTTWIHVAGVADIISGTMRFYYNGVQESTATAPAQIVTNTLALTIGSEPSLNCTRAFQGLMDDVRIYNRALNIFEIKWLAEQLPTAVTIASFTGQSSGEDVSRSLLLVLGLTLSGSVITIASFRLMQR
jgi:large repetitive protein